MHGAKMKKYIKFIFVVIVVIIIIIIINEQLVT